MGLDMYLSKKTFIGSNYEHLGVEVKLEINIEGKPVKINPNRISYIIEEAAYWRKANHIHRWFVDNVQGGNDDCNTYRVSVSQLKELKSLCEKILEKREESFSKEHLPTQGGPFYGDTEYTENYYSDVEDTIDMLSEVTDDLEEKDYNVTFEYTSSW